LAFDTWWALDTYSMVHVVCSVSRCSSPTVFTPQGPDSVAIASTYGELSTFQTTL